MLAGIGMANRQFRRILYQRQFLRFTADAFASRVHMMCENCLVQHSREFEEERVHTIQDFRLPDDNPGE